MGKFGRKDGSDPVLVDVLISHHSGMVAELAAKLKEEGNAAFKEQKYLAAAALYTKALKNDSGTNDAATAILYRHGCALPAG